MRTFCLQRADRTRGAVDESNFEVARRMFQLSAVKCRPRVSGPSHSITIIITPDPAMQAAIADGKRLPADRRLRPTPDKRRELVGVWKNKPIMQGAGNDRAS